MQVEKSTKEAFKKLDIACYKNGQISYCITVECQVLKHCNLVILLHCALVDVISTNSHMAYSETESRK